jgi:dTDP-4-amino-4,6-dideoxygalactose transaminase
MKIPFNKPYLTGREFDYIKQAYESSRLSGDGLFTKKCSHWLETTTGCRKALLTHSCTAALEMAAILIDVQPGDEIIMPSYTFVSTANAFVLRGGIPVLVDIRPDTLNIDEMKIEAAITSKTKAIVPVHYAGVSCEMDLIMAIAKKYNLYVIEDAAQGIMSRYQERALGSMGHLGTYSFHETKNITSGEGGALLINDAQFIERAEIIREKGTNRSQFFRGQVDKYTWVDIGSSFLPGELTAAFLWAQMQEAQEITQRRLAIWNLYHESFSTLEKQSKLHRPTHFIAESRNKGIDVVFHYVPLHNSPAGQQYGRPHGKLEVTENLANRLVRLPLWVGIEEYFEKTIKELLFILNKNKSGDRESRVFPRSNTY